MLELLGTAFGAWPRDPAGLAPAEFFRWKHLESPFGRSLMVVVELDGAIVGFYAYMPWPLRCGARTIATMRAVDLAIDPRHRRLGISLALRTATRYPREVEFVWGNPNAASTGGGRRLGRGEVNGLRSFVRPRASLVRALLARRRPDAAEQQLPAAGHPAALALQDAEPLDRLRERAELGGEQLTTLKQGDFLRWRYARLPSYRAVWVQTPENSALAIFRQRPRGSFLIADVCELLLERRDRALERRALREVGVAVGADLVLCNFSSLPQAAGRGLIGYRTRESLMAHVVRDRLEPDPTLARSWALSRGDLELL